MQRIVRADRLHGLAPAGCRGGVLCIRVMAAEAVPAMHGAAAGGDQQRPPVVLVDHPATASGRAIADRVQAKAGDDAVFLQHRQHLSQQRIARVAVAHAGNEAARHAQRELAGCVVGELRGEVAKPEHRQQLAGVTHGIAPRLLPAQGGGRR